MEFMGFKKCMEFLLGYGIRITSFISDRHVSIACHMRKVLTQITHYFDIWHLKKSKDHAKMILTLGSVPFIIKITYFIYMQYWKSMVNVFRTGFPFQAENLILSTWNDIHI